MRYFCNKCHFVLSIWWHNCNVSTCGSNESTVLLYCKQSVLKLFIYIRGPRKLDTKLLAFLRSSVTFVSENLFVIQVCSDSFLSVETFPIVVPDCHYADISLHNFPDPNIWEFPYRKHFQLHKEIKQFIMIASFLPMLVFLPVARSALFTCFWLPSKAPNLYCCALLCTTIYCTLLLFNLIYCTLYLPSTFWWRQGLFFKSKLSKNRKRSPLDIIQYAEGKKLY